MRTVLMLCILLLFGPVALGYTEGQASEKKRFYNETSISLVNTTGNTDTLSLAGKNEMKYLFSKKWSGS